MSPRRPSSDASASPAALSPVSAPRASRIPVPDLTYEQARWAEGDTFVVGVDDCGRGPLSGPCVCAGVILRPEAHLPSFAGVRDSKTLSAKRQDEIAERIRTGGYREAGVLAWGIGAASVREIDRMGIGRATTLAMARAARAAERMLRRVLDSERVSIQHALIDGLPLKAFPYPHQGIVKGDAKSVSISLAACLAKSTRDALMVKLADRYPAFASWKTDAGYGSKAHMAALAEHGPIPGVHRWSFAPVRLADEAARQRLIHPTASGDPTSSPERPVHDPSRDDFGYAGDL